MTRPGKAAATRTEGGRGEAARASARYSPLLSLSFPPRPRRAQAALPATGPPPAPSPLPRWGAKGGFLDVFCVSWKSVGEVEAKGGRILFETRRRTTLRQNKRRRKCERGADDGRTDGRIAGKSLARRERARGERASFILFKDTGQTGRGNRRPAESVVIQELLFPSGVA